MVQISSSSNFEKMEIDILSSLLQKIEQKQYEIFAIGDEQKRKDFFLRLCIDHFDQFDVTASIRYRLMVERYLESGMGVDIVIGGIGQVLDVYQNKIQREIEDNFDNKYGTQTVDILNHFDLREYETVSKDRLDNCTRYFPSPVGTVVDALEAMKKHGIAYEDRVFIDIGSGMGRNLLIASEYPFKKIIGIEISNYLHQIAEKNIVRYQTDTQKCKDFALYDIDALEFAFPQENLVFYFWEPFNETISNPFVEKLHKFSTETGKHITLIFCEEPFPAVKKSHIFKHIERFDTKDLVYTEGPVYFKISIFTNR